MQRECAHEHVNEIMHPHERFNTDPWPQAPVSAENFENWIGTVSEDRPFFAQVGFIECHLNQFYSGKENPVYPQENFTERGI